MAMGGYHGKGNTGGGQRERARPYGLMLLLAFGAALVGVMALHKLRERHIHNVRLKDKDRELFSLHLLLQKEREYTKEIRKKAEEMRAKIYSLRIQKMELDSRILDMQSTISSLKDEQRTMELVLEEKQEEIKLLHGKQMDTGKRDLQESSLKEILKQKEITIIYLKQQPESVNVSTSGNELQKEKMSKLEEREESGLLHEPSENSKFTRGAGETERKLNVSDGTMLTEKEKLQDQGKMTEEGSAQGGAAGEKNSSEGLGMNRGGSAGSQDEQNSVGKGEMNGLNVNGTANAAAREVPAVVEGKTELKKLKERETSEQPGNISGHSGSTIQRNLRDGSGSTGKGKMWGYLARDQRLESNRNSAMMKHRQFIGDAIEINEGKQLEGDSSKELDQDMNMKKTNKPDQVGDVVEVSWDFNRDNQERKEDSHRHGLESRGKGEESPKTMCNPSDQINGEMPTFRRLESEGRNPTNVGENRAVEVDNRGGGSQEGDAMAENISEDSDSGEAGVSEEEVLDDPEDVREADVEDSRESETERAGSGFFKKGMSEVEDSKDEYKDETDESRVLGITYLNMKLPLNSPLRLA